MVDLAQFFASLVAFLLLEAKFMNEIGLSVFVLIMAINGIILHSITIGEIDAIAKYVNSCEEFIEKREYCPEWLLYFLKFENRKTVNVANNFQN